MSQEDTVVHRDALELAALVRPAWPSITARLRASGVPLNEGDPPPKDDPPKDDPPPKDEPKVFDEDYVKGLRGEAASYRTKANELAAKLQEIEDRDKSDQQKAIERAEAAERRASEAESKVLRADVAADKGVPAKLAKFLTGSTKEDLEKSADELLSELKANGHTSFDGGPRDGQVPAGDMDAAIRRAAGRG